MNEVFALNNEKSWQTLRLTDDKLYLINSSYKTTDEFIKGYENTGLARLLKSKKEIDIYAITELTHAEKEPDELNISHDGKKEMLKFSNPADLQVVTNFLSTQKKFTYKTHQLSPIKAIQSQLIGIALTLLFAWVIYGEAQTIEAGGSIEVSGRRALTKRLMAWLAETLGSTGVLIVAGLALAACGYFIYKNLKTPPNQVVYA